MRAYVLARKGVLITNPDVQKMSIGQWMFEYYSIHKREHDQAELYFKLFKTVLVNVLGLNALKPETKDGKVKKLEEMTELERESFMPMVHWIARPEMMKMIAEQAEMLKLDAELPPPSDKHYEAVLAAIDAAGGDADPIIGDLHNIDLSKIPKDPRKEQQVKQLGILDVKDAKIDLD